MPKVVKRIYYDAFMADHKIGQKMREARLLMGMPICEAEKRGICSSTTVQHVEKNMNCPSFRIIVGLAELYHITVQSLLE